MSNPRVGRAPRQSSPCRRAAAGRRHRADPVHHEDHRRHVGGRRGRLRDLHQPRPARTRGLLLRSSGSTVSPLRWERLHRGQLAQPVIGQPRSSELATATVAAAAHPWSADRADRGHGNGRRCHGAGALPHHPLVHHGGVGRDRPAGRGPGHGHPPAAAGPGRAGGQPVPSRFGDRPSARCGGRGAELGPSRLRRPVRGGGHRRAGRGSERRRRRPHGGFGPAAPWATTATSRSVADGVDGPLPLAEPVPGWQTITVDPERRAVGLLPGTVLDLGATAKAWAADRACAAIADELGCGTLVSLGGDLAVRNAPDQGFTVGIADVCGDRTTTVQVSVASGGLATSGIGRRHWRLGRPPGPPSDRPGDRAAGGHLLEDRVGGRRLLCRRQHRVHRGHGQGVGGGDLAGGSGPAVPPGAHRRAVHHHRPVARRPRGWAAAHRRAPDDAAAALVGAASNGKALWYLTRSTGLVALVLLTATVVARRGGLGGLDHRAVAPVPVPERPPQPVAVLRGLRGHPRHHHGERRLRTHRVRRRLPPLPDPVPAAVRGPRGTDLRPAAGRAGDQRPPAPDRLRLLAVRPLAGLPVLPHRPVPLAGQRHRRPAAPGPDARRGVCRGGRPRRVAGDWSRAGPSPPASGPPPRWARWWSVWPCWCSPPSAPSGPDGPTGPARRPRCWPSWPRRTPPPVRRQVAPPARSRRHRPQGRRPDRHPHPPSPWA